MKTSDARACSSVDTRAEELCEVVRKGCKRLFSKSIRIGVPLAPGFANAITCNHLLVLQEFIDFGARFS
jgi:hypothetical protein